MEKPDNDPILLIEFGKKFKDLLAYHGVSQSELARQVDKLTKDIVNGITVGNRLRSTPLNFLRCLQGLVILEKFTEVKVVEAWLADFYTARGNRRRALEERPEGREILRLIQQMQERRQKALEKPKYRTIEDIPIIGRDEDIEAVLAALKAGTQLFVITGVPGVGKTELARQVSHQAKLRGDFTNTHTISVDSIKEDERNSEAVIDKIRKYLKGIDRQKRTLIVLDSCELLNDIARSEFLNFLGEHEKIVILATSQVLFGKNELKVKPLTVPRSKYEPFYKPEGLLQYEAIHLFCRSAGAINNLYPLTEENAGKVTELCMILGGLPLALNIAAALVKAYSLDVLYKRVLDGDIQEAENFISDSWRHKTLEVLFEISYDLLNEPEKMLFRRLARNPATIEAASSIYNLGDLPTNKRKPHLLDSTLLDNLRKRSLIILSPDEFIEIAHPLLREFARRKLTDNERERLSHRFDIVEKYQAFHEEMYTLLLKMTDILSEEELTEEKMTRLDLCTDGIDATTLTCGREEHYEYYHDFSEEFAECLISTLEGGQMKVAHQTLCEFANQKVEEEENAKLHTRIARVCNYYLAVKILDAMRKNPSNTREWLTTDDRMKIYLDMRFLDAKRIDNFSTSSEWLTQEQKTRLFLCLDVIEAKLKLFRNQDFPYDHDFCEDILDSRIACYYAPVPE
jgi:nitrogen regulatory protein PII